MIGLFDSGHGGLTVFRELVARFPHQQLVYLGDHANAPYGDRPSDEVVALTIAGTEQLFTLGCRLVILACNTATAVACRKMQQEWLPGAGWPGRNVLGIVAPTVEAATQTPWAVEEPQYPQKYKTDVIAVLATSRTVATGVYAEEIKKRCPNVVVVEQACPRLAGAIENGAPAIELEALVGEYVQELMRKLGGRSPDWAILGCTHFPLIEDVFRARLPEHTRLLAQPRAVADSLEDYLARHPEYLAPASGPHSEGTPTEKVSGHENDKARRAPLLLTTGDVERISKTLSPFWQWDEDIGFRPLAETLAELAGKKQREKQR